MNAWRRITKASNGSRLVAVKPLATALRSELPHLAIGSGASPAKRISLASSNRTITRQRTTIRTITRLVGSKGEAGSGIKELLLQDNIPVSVNTLTQLFRTGQHTDPTLLDVHLLTP